MRDPPVCVGMDVSQAQLDVALDPQMTVGTSALMSRESPAWSSACGRAGKRRRSHARRVCASG
jgi:hypothetical protein